MNEFENLCAKKPPRRSKMKQVCWLSGSSAFTNILSQLFAISLVVEADDQCLSFADHWRPEFSRRADHQLGEFRPARFIFLEVDPHDGSPFKRDENFDAVEQSAGLRFRITLLFGAGPGLYLYLLLRKKLLRSYTTLSAGSKIEPVDL